MKHLRNRMSKIFRVLVSKGIRSFIKWIIALVLDDFCVIFSVPLCVCSEALAVDKSESPLCSERVRPRSYFLSHPAVHTSHACSHVLYRHALLIEKSADLISGSYRSSGTGRAVGVRPTSRRCLLFEYNFLPLHLFHSLPPPHPPPPPRLCGFNSFSSSSTSSVSVISHRQQGLGSRGNLSSRVSRRSPSITKFPLSV